MPIALKFLQGVPTTLLGMKKVRPMLSRVITVLMIAAAGPAFAQRSINTNPRPLFGNFGPTSDAISRTNPGTQARERPAEPNQIRNLPAFVPPSQSQPSAPPVLDSPAR
jgi:hypothetical protein